MDLHKNPILETTHNDHHHLRRRQIIPSTSSQDLKSTQEVIIGETSLLDAGKGDQMDEPPQVSRKMVVEESGRERLKRHRVEMSGQVWIPDIWGQEDLLKNWIDSTVFDSSLEKNSIMSAREALMQEGRSTTLRIENSC